VSELALYDDERHAFVGHFDGAGVSQLIWSEPAAGTPLRRQCAVARRGRRRSTTAGHGSGAADSYRFPCDGALPLELRFSGGRRSRVRSVIGGGALRLRRARRPPRRRGLCSAVACRRTVLRRHARRCAACSDRCR
jgi:hypothetical protein